MSPYHRKRRSNATLAKFFYLALFGGTALAFFMYWSEFEGCANPFVNLLPF